MKMTEEIITNGINVAKCEFFNDCECKLYKQEYWERTDTTYDFCKEHPLCEYKATAILKRLEQELKWANDEEKYLKDCCIKAGKELEKYSFKWDGKEKNLVVQALQLNQLYEKLEQENKELKELIGKTRYNRLEMYESFETECNKYRSALEEIREIAEEIIVYENSDEKAEKILNKINEVLE